MNRVLVFLLFFIWATGLPLAQDNKRTPKSSKNTVIRELSKSLEENQSDEQIAVNYEKLAREFASEQAYAKSEENYRKAQNLYLKMKNSEKADSIGREIAKLKEVQNRRELSDVYLQKAQTNRIQNKPEEAISDYENALQIVEKQEDKIKITKEIANVYASNQQMQKAIEINEQLVAQARETADSKMEIKQLQDLSGNYFDVGQNAKALQILDESYRLALARSQTLEAKDGAELLAEYYLKNKNEKQALQIYSDFIRQLGALIRSDSSLVDAKIFQLNEEKITQFEKERALKDELLRKKNTFNYFLIGLIALILLFFAALLRAFLSIRIKNKKIALQSLRREMNPHFIFNSLNSVNQFIAQNNELEANKYLSSYSKLMRTIMEHSNKDFIPLSVEWEQLREYLQLENMRFADKFTYRMTLDPSLDPDALLIPNMLIQPQLENAIWHGLRYREEKGCLLLEIFREQKQLVVRIEDNGIGIRKSQELKTRRQKEHHSRGLTNTRERIELLNELYHTHIQLEIKDKEGAESGVTVILRIPDSIFK